MSAVFDGSATRIPRLKLPPRGRRYHPREIYRYWRDAEPFLAPPSKEWSSALRRARLIGLLLIAAELVVFLVYSWVQTTHFALTYDFAGYAQPIAHIGLNDVNPLATMWQLPAPGRFLQLGGEFILIPLAFIYKLWPNLVMVKWFQDMSLIGAQVIGWLWICDIAAHRERRGLERRAVLGLVGAAIVLLVFNPWTLWASSFDLHEGSLGTVFAVGAARDLHRGRRTALLWAFGGLLCGEVLVSYIGSISLSAMLSGRVRAKLAVGTFVLAVAWFLLLSGLHFNGITTPRYFAAIVTGNSRSPGLGITMQQVVKAAIEHPDNVISALWTNRLDLWAVFSAAGLIGLFWSPVIIVVLVMIVEIGFNTGNALPGFQSILLAPLVTVGTVGVCAFWLVHSRPKISRRLVSLLLALVTLNTAAWAIVWLPQAKKNWIPLSIAQGRELSRIQSMIHPDDEVFASQGIVGGFAKARWLYMFSPNDTINVRVHSRKIWFVVTPLAGIEVFDPDQSFRGIAMLEAARGVHLVAARDGVWAFELNTKVGGPKTLTIGPRVIARGQSGGYMTLPGWILASHGTATAKHSGPLRDWYAASTGRGGYVISQAYWRMLSGTYRATVSLSVATANTNIELWDATTNTLLGRDVVSHTRGAEQHAITVHLRHTVGQPTVHGWGPWSDLPLTTSGDSLEVRVWTPPGKDGGVKVYSVGMRRLGGASS